ncbi:hypothetical protein DPEC_G00086830 [Dallia pectoralis]|uniref:Uncharacterized protein n=1 Tax=Dallia pectoralis TaxID=75939 RepID=A0ACC2GZP2_DALPE|nr:hypothetical protein DPEC_G00086830 [Dallia pectoralis]
MAVSSMALSDRMGTSRAFDDYSLYSAFSDDELIQLAIERSFIEHHNYMTSFESPRPNIEQRTHMRDYPRRNSNTANPPRSLPPADRFMDEGRLGSVIKNGDLKALKEIAINNPTSLLVANDDGWISLHEAAYYGQEECLKIILKVYPETVNRCGTCNQTPLLLSAVHHHVNCVECLLAHGANPDIANKEGETPLHKACSKSNIEIVQHLLKYGASVNNSCDYSLSPLHEAAGNDNVEICQMLLEAGADLDATSIYGINSFFMAAQNGGVNVVSFLMRRGVFIDCQASNGATPLYEASKNGHKEVVELLLLNKADANKTAKCGLLPLHVAVQKGHFDIVSMLIPATNKYRVKLCGISPLHLAAEYNRDWILELLTEAGYDVNVQLSEDRTKMFADRRSTALYFAVANNNIEATKILLDAGANPNLDMLNPFLIAVRRCCLEMTFMLVEHGANVNASILTHPCSFPAAILLSMKDLCFLKYLMDNGCDARSCFDCTYGSRPHPPLKSPRRNRFTQQNLDDDDTQPNTCVQFCEAISEPTTSRWAGPIIDVLLDYVGPVKLCSRLIEHLDSYPDWAGIRLKAKPPHSLMQMCRLKIRQQKLGQLPQSNLILDEGRDEVGTPPYHINLRRYPTAESEAQSQKPLLKEEWRSLRGQTNQRGDQQDVFSFPLESCESWGERSNMAVANMSMSCLTVEPTLGFDDYSLYSNLSDDEQIQLAIERSFSDAHYANALGETSITPTAPGTSTPQYRTNPPENRMNSPNPPRQEPSHRPPTANPTDLKEDNIVKAILNGDATTVQTMIKDEANNILQPDKYGWIPLHEAAYYGQEQCVTILLSAQPEMINKCDLKGQTALILAVGREKVACVKALLEKGADPELATKERETPLYKACERENAEIVAMLLNHGVVVNRHCIQGWTALQEAVSRNSVEICEMLVQAGAMLSPTNIYGITPLFTAAQSGRVETLRFLIKHGADINSEATDGATALYEAAKNGHEEIVALLLWQNADANKACGKGLLPLHIAAQRGTDGIVSMLINATSKSRVRRCGISPLHLAAERNRNEVLKVLIDAGYDVNAMLSEERSKMYEDHRRTTLYFAVANGNVEATTMLLEAGANPNLDTFNPVLVAARQGSIELVTLLVRYGANVNAYVPTQPTSFSATVMFSMKNLSMLKYLMDNGCDAHSCFSCTYGSGPHPSIEATTERDFRYSTDTCRNTMKPVQFCEVMSTLAIRSWAGPIIDILLDYVGHVKLCSRLTEHLDSSEDWEVIKQKARKSDWTRSWLLDRLRLV